MTEEELEPLKGKTQDFNNHNWYHEDDIKSAVEWLKERKLGNKLNPFDFEEKEMIVFYKKDFDEAFRI